MTALLIALVALGLNSYRKLSLESLPSVGMPYVTVATIWPGVSPEDIEKDVATCIENAGNSIVECVMGTDMDVAAQDVREKIDAIVGELPSSCERPAIAKLDLNAAAVATVFLSGDLPPDDLYWLADNQIRDRFAAVKGVAEVRVIGAVNRIGIGAASVGGILVAGAFTLLVLPFVAMTFSRRR